MATPKSFKNTEELSNYLIQTICKEVIELDKSLKNISQVVEGELNMSEKKYTIELTQEQLKQLGIEIPIAKNEDKVIKSPFERVKGNSYYYIDECGQIGEEIEEYEEYDNELYDVGNYYVNKELIKQRAYHRILDDLLFRFSMMNGGVEINWDGEYQNKYCIHYNNKENEFMIDSNQYMKRQGSEYFLSREIAQRAIDEIITPFIKEHPDFVW